MSNIFKCWGERRRILLDEKNEIDLLYVNKNSFCSTHVHQYKTNKFILISGAITVETELGYKILKISEPWEVIPPIKHRFVAYEDSVMIEIAYVKEGKIYLEDIDRESQGGKIIKGKELTLDQMREKGLLDL